MRARRRITAVPGCEGRQASRLVLPARKSHGGRDAHRPHSRDGCDPCRAPRFRPWFSGLDNRGPIYSLAKMDREPTKPRAHRGAAKALALLLTINLFNYIDRQILAAVEPSISAELRLKETSAGLLARAYLYAYIFDAPI